MESPIFTGGSSTAAHLTFVGYYYIRCTLFKCTSRWAHAFWSQKVNVWTNILPFRRTDYYFSLGIFKIQQYLVLHNCITFFDILPICDLRYSWKEHLLNCGIEYSTSGITGKFLYRSGYMATNKWRRGWLALRRNLQDIPPKLYLFVNTELIVGGVWTGQQLIQYIMYWDKIFSGVMQ